MPCGLRLSAFLYVFTSQIAKKFLIIYVYLNLACLTFFKTQSYHNFPYANFKFDFTSSTICFVL